MVRLDTTNDYYSTDVNSTMPVSYGYQVSAYSEFPKAVETEKANVTRLALEKNRASWVVFNDKMPTIKQFINPVNVNARRYLKR